MRGFSWKLSPISFCTILSQSLVTWVQDRNYQECQYEQQCGWHQWRTKSVYKRIPITLGQALHRQIQVHEEVSSLSNSPSQNGHEGHWPIIQEKTAGMKQPNMTNRSWANPGLRQLYHQCCQWGICCLFIRKDLCQKKMGEKNCFKARTVTVNMIFNCLVGVLGMSWRWSHEDISSKIG